MNYGLERSSRNENELSVVKPGGQVVIDQPKAAPTAWNVQYFQIQLTVSSRQSSFFSFIRKGNLQSYIPMKVKLFWSDNCQMYLS